MNAISTDKNTNLDLAFYQSIEKAIEAGNQIMLDSALRSNTIITADQKFKLVKLAIEKRSLPIFEYICYLKSATDISDEQTDKLIELIRKSSQNEDQELLYIIDRLQNINEKLDNETQHNGAMKIISDLNEKKLFKTNPLLSLPGNKGLTQSGTDFKPNHRQVNTKQNHYLEPNTDKPSNWQSNKSEPPLPAQGKFNKNPDLLAKSAKYGLLKTREPNLDGYGAKGSYNNNSVLSRPLPAIPSRNNNGDGGKHNIYEKIKEPSILKKPNEKDSSQVKITKIVTFDPALSEDLTDKILPVKDVPISDNTKGDNQKNNDFNLSPKSYSATNNAPIDSYIAERDKNNSDLLNTLLSTETPVSLQKNTVSANFKATQDAIKELFQPNNKETSSSDRPSFVRIISPNNEKQPMPVMPQSHIPIAPPMPAESKTTTPPPPPMPAFLAANQGNQKIPTTLSKQQQTISGPNTSSAKAGPQSKLELNPEALSNARTKLKSADEVKSFINMVVHNNANNPQSNFTGNKKTSSANNTSQPPISKQELEAVKARLRKTGNDGNQITHF
jgi:hypothetical protein